MAEEKPNKPEPGPPQPSIMDLLAHAHRVGINVHGEENMPDIEAFRQPEENAPAASGAASEPATASTPVNLPPAAPAAPAAQPPTWKKD